VGILDDVTKDVPASFQRAGDAIILMWPIPIGEEPDPKLKVPFKPIPMSQVPLPALEPAAGVHEEPEASDDAAKEGLTGFGSSEYAKVVLGSLWGKPPALDLNAEADLQRLLIALAAEGLLHSARDISDGGLAVSLAQAAFASKIGAKVEQEPALMVHPLFGLFAEPASTVIVTASPGDIEDIQAIAVEHNCLGARIGTTGGNRLEISVYSDPLISAPLEELRKPWAESLEAALHDEVTA